MRAREKGWGGRMRDSFRSQVSSSSREVRVGSVIRGSVIIARKLIER